jgi:hypothetical protein
MAQVWFDGEIVTDDKEQTIITDALVKGTIIWCKKWNQGCCDVAYYDDATLVALQFATAARHSLKFVYIRRLRKGLSDLGHTLTRLVHVGVRKGDDWGKAFGGAEGAGRAVNGEEFKVEVFRSEKLRLTTGCDEFRCPPQEIAALFVGTYIPDPYHYSLARTYPILTIIHSPKRCKTEN